MQLSLHSDYALRILMTLAASGEQLSVEQIANRFGISRHHLAKIAAELQNEGLLISKRGRAGGIRLGKPPEDINVGDVIRRFERLDGFVTCLEASPSLPCAVNGACALKPALAGALEAFLAHMDQFRLSDLIPNRAAFLQLLALREQPATTTLPETDAVA